MEINTPSKKEQVWEAVEKAAEKMSPAEIAEKTGVNGSTVRGYLRSFEREGLLEKDAYGLYSLKRSVETIEEPHNGDGAASEVPLREEVDARADRTMVHLPLVSVRGSAGDGEVPWQTEISRYVSYDEEQLRREVGLNPTRLMVMVVAGTSMMPTILPGERVVVALQKDGDPILDSAVYVWQNEHSGVVIKRARWQKDGSLLLESDNRDDPRDFQISRGEEYEWQLIGRVVRVEKNL